MLKHQEQQSIVYNSNGVDFTIYATTKPTKSGPKGYWVLEERLTTGKRRLLNNKSLKTAKERADKIRAAALKGQANRMSLSNGQWQDIWLAIEVLRNAPTGDSLYSATRSWLECVHARSRCGFHGWNTRAGGASGWQTDCWLSACW